MNAVFDTAVTVARVEVGVGVQVQNVAGVPVRGRGTLHWGTTLHTYLAMRVSLESYLAGLMMDQLDSMLVVRRINYMRIL